MTGRRRIPALALVLLLAGCGTASPAPAVPTSTSGVVDAATQAATASAEPTTIDSVTASTIPGEPTSTAVGTNSPSSVSGGPTVASGASSAGNTPGTFTFAFAGDVNFAERTADRLAADPTTAFGAAAAELSAANLTMVNLETAIATGGEPEDKSFTFRAPPSALTALQAAGVDVATMANNHGADYGAEGLQETIAAIDASGFPVIGIGADDTRAYAPFTATVNGVRLAVFAATQVHDHTLAYFSAGPGTPGVASADSDQLVDAVSAAAGQFDVVVVYLHWGTEYVPCPDAEQQSLADALAAAGATAVVGAHAHVLQGAGWREDGVYVAYGLSNYLWWRSFGNEQDDNGVLTLTFAPGAVTAASFSPAHLDDTGVPVPASGFQRDRIELQWESVRECAGLGAAPPS